MRPVSRGKLDDVRVRRVLLHRHLPLRSEADVVARSRDEERGLLDVPGLLRGLCGFTEVMSVWTLPKWWGVARTLVVGEISILEHDFVVVRRRLEPAP